MKNMCDYTKNSYLKLVEKAQTNEKSTAMKKTSKSATVGRNR
jgi:hypothetical protein